MRKQETLAAQTAIRAALGKQTWTQRALFAVGGAFIGYLADGWTGAAWGAGAGLVADTGLELFKIRL